MKLSVTFLTVTITAILVGSAGAAAPVTEGRTLTDLNVISTRVLQRSISPKFYKSLLISPIQGWIVVRANLSGTRLTGMRVIHSELKGVYDSLALKLANEAQIAGYDSLEHPYFGSSVLLHVLIYQIADGTMALSFPTFDGPGGDQMQYWGCARLAVLSDGKWTEIEGPEGLQGKGWAVRKGLKNKYFALRKMERGP